MPLMKKAGQKRRLKVPPGPALKAGPLKWTYCECGCKGFTISAAGLNLWYYWDLKESYQLYRGHGFVGVFLGEYLSLEELNKVARKNLSEKYMQVIREFNNLVK